MLGQCTAVYKQANEWNVSENCVPVADTASNTSDCESPDRKQFDLWRHVWPTTLVSATCTRQEQAPSQSREAMYNGKSWYKCCRHIRPQIPQTIGTWTATEFMSSSCQLALPPYRHCLASGQPYPLLMIWNEIQEDCPRNWAKDSPRNGPVLLGKKTGANDE